MASEFLELIKRDKTFASLCVVLVVIVAVLAFEIVSTFHNSYVLNLSACTRMHPIANDILDCQATRMAATVVAGDK